MSAAAGRDTPPQAPAGPGGAPVRARGRCGRRGGWRRWGNRSPSAAPVCHLHCARGPSGGRISPWRDLVWGRPPWSAAGHLPAGPAGARAAPAGAAPEPLGGTAVESGPAATSVAGSDLEAIAGSRRCRETTCPCLLRREAQRAQGAAAGAQRRAPGPAGQRSGHPRARRAPGQCGSRRGRGTAWVEGVRRGGYSQRALCCGPPGPLPSLWPLPGPSRRGSGRAAAVGGCGGTRAGVSCSRGGLWAGSVQGAPRGRLQ